MPFSVGVWAGGFHSPKSDWKQGLKRLEELGFAAIVPSETARYVNRKDSRARPFLAGPDAAKVKAFAKLWKNDKLQDILCVRGGYGIIRLLPALDKLRLSKKPKRIWGFSDVTVLQMYLFHRFGLPWAHSPMATSRALLQPVAIEKRIWKHAAQPAQRHTLKALHRAGQLPQRALMVGGNLTCLASMCGTPWLPKIKKPFFLFLEDVGEKPYRIDRLLEQLHASGFMKSCKAIVLGHFSYRADAHRLIAAWGKEHKLSVFSGLKAGHEAPNLALPMGVTVTLANARSAKAALVVPDVRLGSHAKGKRP